MRLGTIVWLAVAGVLAIRALNLPTLEPVHLVGGFVLSCIGFASR